MNPASSVWEQPTGSADGNRPGRDRSSSENSAPRRSGRRGGARAPDRRGQPGLNAALPGRALAASDPSAALSPMESRRRRCRCRPRPDQRRTVAPRPSAAIARRSCEQQRRGSFRTCGHAGRRSVALVTGASRRAGIGCAIAYQLLAVGSACYSVVGLRRPWLRA